MEVDRWETPKAKCGQKLWHIQVKYIMIEMPRN